MPNPVRSLCTLFLTLLAAGVPLRAQAGLLVPTSTGRPDPKVLSLREMTIDVGIARGYARVNVRQVFENHTPDIQEGTYRFALPPSAAVGDFAVWDALVRIPGVILEKARARAIYRELTTQKIGPGLLQQGEEEDRQGGSEDGEEARATQGRPTGSALFSVKVAPIPGLATKRLELQFQQEVPIIHQMGEFRLALKPPTGEPTVARHLEIHVHLEDGTFEALPGTLPLQAKAGGATFRGQDVKLDRDLALRIRPTFKDPLRLSAFRNPEGRMPDGLALAPWERPSEIPPEKDGFFLLEALPGGSAPKSASHPPKAAPRPGQNLVILFDTSLGHRWGGLEVGYGHLVRVLGELRPGDRFALVPFDRLPVEPKALRPSTPRDIEAELANLRNRPLAPGANLPAALKAARNLLGTQGQVLLVTSGEAPVTSKALREALGPLTLSTLVTTGEAREGLRAASSQVLSPTATELEADLFFQRLLDPRIPEAETSVGEEQPFTVTGGKPRLRHIYPVMVQPLEAGSLSGWVGRYETPQSNLTWELPLPKGKAQITADLPERALEARDLPRRWARARVDDLLAKIEAEGEKREWVEEVIAPSKRYKFVTPYTAFLAAPRALLRPRLIQPGDPVLRVDCDAGTVAAVALFPFGLRLDLVRCPGTTRWEGRFLVPEGFKDGRHPVRILVRDASGATVTETKHFVLDGKAPVIRPALPATARAGEPLRLEARTDGDVVLLQARVGDLPPVPLRWDPSAKASIGLVHLPPQTKGRQDVFFEAVDGAKNRGFARTTVEVRQ